MSPFKIQKSIASRSFAIFTTCLVLLSFNFNIAMAAEQIEYARDQIAFRFTNVRRSIVISDIHGDMKALLRILTAKKLQLFDRNENWIGGDTKLVINGDLIDGDPDSELILDFVYGSLRDKITQGGGSLEINLGNHELMAIGGDESHMDKAEKELFARADGSSGKKDFNEIDEHIRHMFRAANGRYASELRGNNFFTIVNRTLIIHAGLVRPMLDMSRTMQNPGDINVIGREFIKFFQNLTGYPPSKHFDWIVDLEKDPKDFSKKQKFTEVTGPLSDRSFKIETGKNASRRPEHGLTRKELKELLAWFDVDQIVIGHSPTPDSKINFKHPYYGRKVISIDTHRAEIFGGEVTALEILAGENGRDQFIAHHLKRRTKDENIKSLRKAQKEESLSKPRLCRELFL